MKLITLFLVIILAVGFIGTCSVIGMQNGAITRKNECDAQWGQVENVLQRRADLVPNLVATVKGAADFEKSTLTAVTEARASATQIRLSADDLSDPAKIAQFQKAQDTLSGALSRLMMVSERYPELKASENFRDLQVQLEGTENRIAEERRKYNLVVQALNNYVETFPSGFGAKFAGVTRREPFKASPGADAVPEVTF